MTQFFFRHGPALTEDENDRVLVRFARGDSGYLTRDEDCSRCGGAGWFAVPQWPEGGICFQCRGRCQLPRTHRVFSAEKLAVLVNAADKKTAKKIAEATAKRERQRQDFITWAKPHGKLIGGILTAKGRFMSDLASKLRQRWTLSEKQLDAAQRILTSQAEQVAQDAASNYVGVIKTRIEFEAHVIGVYGSEGFYGHTDIVKFRDADGNLFVWFASGYTGLEREDRISIKGTIKEHSEFRGVKQTALTRCKFKKFTVMTPDEAAQAEVL